MLHQYLESSYLVNQFFDVIFYVQPPRHFCTLGTPREYRLNIGFTYWDVPKIFKVYEKSRCARDKYKAEVFRTQEHLFGAWQCKQTIFNSFSEKRVAVCKDAMVKSLNNVHFVSFVSYWEGCVSAWHIFIYLTGYTPNHKMRFRNAIWSEVPVFHVYVCCTIHIKNNVYFFFHRQL